MTVETFAAKRTGQQDRAIERLHPLASRWLNDFASDDALGDLVDAATDVWLDTFEAIAPQAYIDKAVGGFRTMIGKSLQKTTEPDGVVAASQIQRVATWLATVATNDATWQGFHASGGIRMRWVSRRDERTRLSHRAANGQIRNVTGAFDVGGAELRYPGDPRGPLEETMECRCVLAPAGSVRTRRTGIQASATAGYDGPETEEMDMTDALTAAAATDEEVEAPVADVDLDVENPEETVPDGVDISEEGLTDEILIEIPVHGVATIEGKATGDGRMFALGALTNRPLPLPMRYEFVGTHGGSTSDVAPVGRIDELWKQEVDGYVEYRFRGVIITTKAYANEAVEGIADGSLTGVSVETDDITVDVTEARENLRQQITADRDASADAEAEVGASIKEMSDEDIESLIDMMVGDGTAPVTMFSSARVCGFTIVPIPAFPEGYIALGEAFEDEISDEDREALAACGCYQPAEGDEPEVIRGEDEFLEALMASASQAIDERSDRLGLLERYATATNPEYRALIRRTVSALSKSLDVPEELLTFAPGTKDGPGWITHPRATARIRRYWVSGKGAAKIRWGAPGDFNRCRTQLAKYVQNPDWLAGLCANMHKEALGFWPAQHHSVDGVVASAASGRATAVDSFMTLVETEPVALIAGASWPDAFPSEYFTDPHLTEETPITIDGDRVYGHVATWDSCHIGMPGICQNPPASKTDYSYFRKGVIDTDKGPLRVGTLTFGTGHIGIRATAAQATAHYDKPQAVRAYVVVGEDATGIWFSGVLKPGLRKDDIKEFRALGAISGDWRPVKGNLELVGVTAVNTNGFQLERKSALVAAANGVQTALITPPIVRHDPKPAEALVASGGKVPTPLEVASIARIAAQEVLHQQAIAPRVAQVKAVREQELAARIERVRQHREA